MEMEEEENVAPQYGSQQNQENNEEEKDDEEDLNNLQDQPLAAQNPESKNQIKQEKSEEDNNSNERQEQNTPPVNDDNSDNLEVSDDSTEKNNPTNTKLPEQKKEELPKQPKVPIQILPMKTPAAAKISQPAKVEIAKAKEVKPAEKKEAKPQSIEAEKEEVKNNYYDKAIEISDPESVESEKEEAIKKEHMSPNPLAQAKVQQLGADLAAPKGPLMPIGYNPSDYANLSVSAEITELFQYITRFKPQPIDLDTKIKPFIPEFIPAVGEVDAFLKIPRPDGASESLGLSLIDEPTLTPSDPSVLEIQYTQINKPKSSAPIVIRSIENAEKNPKEIQQWVGNINELHKTSPPQTVQYSKQMPDIEMLMQEWPLELEEALEKISFPGQDLKISLEEYAKVICMMLDIPIHQLTNSKSLVEALHVAFILYLEFKQNPHFQKIGKQGMGNVQSNDVQVEVLKKS